MDVNLSKAVRSNLLSLQNTATMMGKTQERLATGLKVNSALDNPTHFFTASGLKSRAGDLGQLMDSVGNAVQTIQAADKGIKAITKLVESAQATARQALQTAAPAAAAGGSGTATATATGEVPFANDTAATSGATTGSFADLADGDELVVNGTTYTFQGTVTDAATQFSSVAELENLIDAQGVSVAGATNLTFTADTTATDITLSGSAAVKLGVVADPTDTETFSATSTDIQALTGTIDYDIGGSTGSIDLSTLNSVDDLVAAFTNAGFTASNEAGGLEISATEAFTLTDDSGGEVAAVFGAGATSGDEVAATGGAAPGVGETSKRAELLTQYNDLLDQIDQLAKDAGFNGVNLLQGDDLSVIFNEDGSSKLDIGGVDMSATGTNSLLGLSKETNTAAWDTNAGINETLADLKEGH